MPKILVPLDGSERSARVLAAAERLAQDMHAEVFLLLVLEPAARDAADDAADRGHQYLRDLQASLRPATSIGVREAPTPLRGILDAIDEEGIDLVVMSSHGKSGADEMPLGSVARDLLKVCTVPVTIVGLAA